MSFQQAPTVVRVKDDDIESYTTQLCGRNLTIVYADAATLAQVLPKTNIGAYLEIL
jgi:hypothetical protein